MSEVQRRHPDAECENCPLLVGGEFVPSDGPTKSDLVIVGEAPGANESKVGKPFIGESGQLLTSILRHYQMDRKQIRITNACLCRDSSGATPSAKALQACRPRLMKEVRESEATKVLALGNSATQSLLDTKLGVTTLRMGFGRTNEAELPGARIYPSFHPAACLRVASFFPSLVSDIGKAHRGETDVHWYEPRWKAFDDPDEALAALRELEQRSGPVVVDIESDIEKDMCVAPGTRILKRDLTWAPAETLIEGDELVAFDENCPTDMKVGVVYRVGTTTKRRYRITTTRNSIVCSEKHLWPVRSPTTPGYTWRTTKYLFDNQYKQALSLAWLAEPWDVDNSREGGYIAGLLDGEGALVQSRQGPQKYCNISQNAGPVYDEAVALLTKAGFKLQTGVRNSTLPKSPSYVQVCDRDQILRLMGTYRPIRLLPLAESIWKKHIRHPRDPILSVEYVDEGEVVMIETSTKTMVAEGFLSHNSFDQPTRHTLLCVGLGYERGKVVVLGEIALRDGRVRDALRRYLVGRPFRGQNAKFDSKGLWAYLGVMLPVDMDSMLLNYVQDERPGIHSLEYQGIELLGAPDWKHVLDKYKKPGRGYGAIVETDEGRQVLYQYNAWDVHITDLLIDLHLREIYKLPVAEPVKRMADGRARSLLDVHNFLCRAGYHLSFTEVNGMGIDLPYNKQLWIEYQEVLTNLRKEIASTIPNEKWVSFNPNSPLQVKKVIKEEFGMRLPMKLNTKKEFTETTDADALEGLAEKALGTPAEKFFRKMLEHRKEAKQFGTYVKGIRKRVYRGRVNSVFLLHGTTTGRLSSRNPNLQNIIRSAKIKRQFVPIKQDHVFVQGDFGQAELRVLCWLAQDEYLRGVFNDPSRDLFTELTPRLYGDVSQLADEAIKELRIRVKAYVYGLSYGREAMSIALEYDLPIKEAERGMREFFKVIPQVVSFRESTRLKVLQGEDLVTPFGRHRRFWLITRSNRKDVLNEALAFLPQSTASDITVDAACNLRPRLKGIGWIRNLVHDSILVECHKDDVELVKTLLNEEMLAAARRVVGDYVKFKVDIEMGPSWGDLKKAALCFQLHGTGS